VEGRQTSWCPEQGGRYEANKPTRTLSDHRVLPREPIREMNGDVMKPLKGWQYMTRCLTTML
jgi:hypothetical protein